MDPAPAQTPGSDSQTVSEKMRHALYAAVKRPQPPDELLPFFSDALILERILSGINERPCSTSTKAIFGFA
jgi:hypothetical protein